jgi:cysteine desulfurase
MERKVYLDNAATTMVRPEVVETMNKYYTELYGNPSSIYEFGQKAKKALGSARETVAGIINAETDEIYFTGSGSEADNWAIKGVAEKYSSKGKHIITSKIEHHAILHSCEYLEKNGFEVTYLEVDEYGMISLDDLKTAIKEETILITIMFANNEIGTIEPVKEIGAIAKENNIFFHTDAVQAFGHIPIDVEEMNIDMLSASAHKINGPKGVGMLYIKKGIRLENLIHGGAQERKMRAGTENVPGIMGFAKAVEIAGKTMDESIKKMTVLRDRFMKLIPERIDNAKLNGHPVKRLPGNVNFSFEFIEGESLLLYLDMDGISGSSGSACTSGALDPSHVLMGIGLAHEIAHGSLRLSLSDFNTEEEVDYTVEKLVNVVDRLRQMSPLYTGRRK